MLSGCYGLFEPPTPDVPVIAPAPADKRAAPLRFGRIKNRLRYGTDIGGFAGGLICGPFSGGVPVESIKGAFTASNLVDIFYRTMSYAGYDVAEDPALLFDEEEDFLRGELIVSGSLVDLKVLFCDRRFLFGLIDEGVSGEVQVRMDWTVYSKLRRRVLYEKTTTGRAVAGRGRFAGDLALVSEAVAAALEYLAADDGFRDVVFDTAKHVGPELLGPGRPPPPGAGPGDWGGDPGVYEHLVIEAPRPAWRAVRGEAERVVRGVVQVGGPGFGSGFFIGTTPDGAAWLLTNNHVVGEAERVRLTTRTGAAMEGQVVRRNPRRDVALIRTEAKAPAFLPIREETLELGEDVYAIGTPLRESRRRSLTKGIVSAFRVDRDVNLPMIQADVIVHGGMSGGPLVDESGTVVGITYQTDIGEDGLVRAAGLSFFIPIMDALERLDVELVPAAQ